MEIRYLDTEGAKPKFAFFINNIPRGGTWAAAGTGAGWTSHVIRDVMIALGDDVRLDIDGAGARIDFSQLNPPGAAPQPPKPRQVATPVRRPPP